MPVTGTNIPAGTTVKSVTTSIATGTPCTVTTSVTLSAPVSGDVPNNTSIAFNPPLPTVTATTTSDTPSGKSLPFATAPGTTGIQAGMLVAGTNIPGGTTVSSVSATSVTLSNNVLGDVPNGSVITFTAAVPPNALPSTLADQIFAWLPSTTSPPTPTATIATLIAVSASQWTAFFEANPGWLPLFTQPVAPGVSAAPTAPSAGYDGHPHPRLHSCRTEVFHRLLGCNRVAELDSRSAADCASAQL